MPVAAFEDLSERLTKALISGDFGQYRSVFWLPLRIESRATDSYVLNTEAGLRRDFDLYRIALTVNGVTDIVRRLRFFEANSPEAVTVHVEVDILRGGERLVRPFPSRFSMRHQGEWRFDAIESAPGHIRWTLGQGPLDGCDLD